MNVNGQQVSAIVGLDYLYNVAKRKRKERVHLYDIKKKNPDGTFQLLPSIIIEFE
jgi:hypothetical protein